jgi:hypothetical protein
VSSLFPTCPVDRVWRIFRHIGLLRKPNESGPERALSIRLVENVWLTFGGIQSAPLLVCRPPCMMHEGTIMYVCTSHCLKRRRRQELEPNSSLYAFRLHPSTSLILHSTLSCLLLLN